MDITINQVHSEVLKNEIRDYINEGLQDMYNNKLLDFDTTFDELEKRYSAND